MKKYKPQMIFDPIYKMNFYISRGVHHKIFEEAYHRIIGDKVECRTASGCTFFVIIKGQRVTWIWTKDERVPFLVHEIIHAVTEHFDFIGMRLTNDSDEAYAYYTQWLLEEILDND